MAVRHSEVSKHRRRSYDARHAIADVALAVAAELDPKRSAHSVVSETRRVLGADGVMVWAVSEEGKRLRLLAHRGFPAPMIAGVRSLPFRSPTLSGRAAVSGEIQVLEDMREAAPELATARELAREYGFRSIVAVPLIARGRLVGVMTFATKRLQHFSPEQLEAVTAIARIFALGLDNAIAYARERELRAELEALVASSPEGILLLEAPSGRTVLANKAAEGILGRPLALEARLEELSAHYGLRRLNGAPFPPHELPPARAFRGQTVLGVQLLVRQPSGRDVPVRVSAAPVRGEEGNVLAAVVLFQDISREKELERQRQEMTAMIAHDLRSPIAVIAGYSELLLDKAEQHGLPKVVREALERMRGSAKSLDRLVADLLDVGRLEAGRLTLHRQWIELPELAGEVVARLQAAIATHHPTVALEGHLPPVWADPGRVEQILTNLLTNAAKYSPAGTEVTVRMRPAPGEVVIAVADQGPGIPPAERAHIFEPYYRVRTPGTRPEGLGLGLYITRGLVEAQGGRVWLDSEIGKGTTFYFTLPTGPKPQRRRPR